MALMKSIRAGPRRALGLWEEFVALVNEPLSTAPVYCGWLTRTILSSQCAATLGNWDCLEQLTIEDLNERYPQLLRMILLGYV